jgi:hypothetical protein
MIDIIIADRPIDPNIVNLHSEDSIIPYAYVDSSEPD